MPFQFLNFRFVPPQLTVAAANLCAIAWNVILSLLSHTSAFLSQRLSAHPAYLPRPPEIAEQPAVAKKTIKK